MNPGFDYVKVKDPASGRVYIVAQCRLGELPGAVPKEGKKGKEATPGFQVCTKSGQTGKIWHNCSLGHASGVCVLGDTGLGQGRPACLSDFVLQAAGGLGELHDLHCPRLA